MRSRGSWYGAAVVAATLAVAPGAASAEEEDGFGVESVDLQWHGFVSQGFLVTTDNDFLAKSQRGSFEFAEAGVNLTASLGDQLRLGIQLFTRDLGPSGDYRIKADWFYLDYRWRDWLGVRAGRVKLPFGLYNDTADIDAAHNVVLLPQSVYPSQNRDFLLAQTGVEAYGYHDTGAAGALEYRVYGGTIFLETERQPGQPFEVAELTVPYVVGARLMWEPPLEGLRVGASVQALRLESELLYPMQPAPVAVDVPAVLWVTSLEYLWRDWLLAAEYGRWHVSYESSDPMLFPESRSVSERGYVLAAYRLRPRLQAGAYYSLLYPDVEQRSGRAAQQHDAALSLRFDVNPHWLLKLEGHFMHGTAALSPALNGAPRDELAANWGLFLAKATAHF